MPKKYDVVAITGEYEKNGQTKPRYQNVGMVIEKDGKFYLKLTSLAFHDDGHVCNFFSLYEPRERSQGGPDKPQGGDDFNDPIPF
jgi:hypothetical protein